MDKIRFSSKDVCPHEYNVVSFTNHELRLFMDRLPSRLKGRIVYCFDGRINVSRLKKNAENLGNHGSLTNRTVKSDLTKNEDEYGGYFLVRPGA